MKIGALLGCILALIITTCACSSKLGRSSALEQIQAYEKNDGVLAPMKKYFSLPSAIFVDSMSSMAQKYGSNWQEVSNAEHLTLGFYKNLAFHGFIRQEPACNIHQVPDATYYCFAPAGQYTTLTPIAQYLRGTSADRNLNIAMARISRETVTGIAENASQNVAQVDVEYILSPTPAFKVIEDFNRETNATYANAAQLPEAHWQLSWSLADVTGSAQKHYLFQKYDDGWRLGM